MPGYVGVGDIVSGGLAWYGLRAYSAAKGRRAAVPLMDIQPAGGGAATTINCNTAGGILYASIPAGSICSKLYDQIGTRHLVQATVAAMPAVT